MKEKMKWSSVFKIAGAFVAFVVGSGFATGQEILQFFTSFGWGSLIAVGIALAEFVFFGTVLVRLGLSHKEEGNFRQYPFCCGKILGTVYDWAVPVILVLMIPVLLAGVGATVEQSWGIPKAVGSAVMAILVLLSYLIGFQKFVKIVSAVSPVIILFSVFVGVWTVVSDFGNVSAVSSWEGELATHQTSFHPVLSAVLYLSSNFFPGSGYYVKLGSTAVSEKEATVGSVIGAIALMAVIAVMNAAILLNGSEASALSVPTLYLAGRISPVLASVFTVVLVLGIFSSCSSMLWSLGETGERLFPKKSGWFIGGCMAIGFALSLFPFGGLMGVLYPAIGYIGIPYFVCLTVRLFQSRKKEKLL